MKPGMRKSGIDIAGDIPWGTHFALFYRTKEDLIDILVPYFKAGLENNEHCLWVTAKPLDAGEARTKMAAAMPDFDRYEKKGQIEIIPYTDWYTIDGKFDGEQVLYGWINRLRQARAKGYDGLRLTGNESWLDREIWNDFIEYEQTIDKVIDQYHMLGVCSYPEDQCDASDILDVVSTHQFTLNRRDGDWKIIEDQGQKRAIKALRDSEASLAKSQEMAHIGSWELDVATGEIERSAESYRIFGLAPDEYMITYEKFLGFVVPEDRGRVANACGSSVKSGKPYDVTFSIRRKDGEIRVLHSKAEPIKDPSGRVVKLFGTNQDITERKRAEEALRESEEQLRLASRAAGIGVWSWVPGTSHVVVSANWRQLFGIPADAEVTFETWVGSLHPEDRDRAVRELSEASEQHREFDTEYRVVRPDGTMRWIVDRGNAWYDGKGRPAGMAGVNVDITGRKQSEEALRWREAELARAQEIARTGSWTFDVVKDELTWSDECYRIYGLEPGQTRPTLEVFLNLIVPEDRVIVGNVIQEAMKTGKSHCFEYTIRRSDGVPRIIYSEGECVKDMSGRLVKIFGINQDITERRKADDAVKAATAQAELYLDLMGHDINNINQIALGYLEIARDMHADEDLKEFIDKPMEVLQRSTRLIGNVRKLQKLHEGALPASIVDLFGLLADVQREFGSVPDKAVTLDLNGCKHCRVQANELLYDVFANLVTNALKHTGERADIRIGLENLTDDGRHYCRATVEDDGPGIPDEFKGRIFNRLLKGTDKAKGMGLGLYLVKSLVESYGGRVWVEDRVKDDHTKGAKFVVMLPAFMENETD